MPERPSHKELEHKVRELQQEVFELRQRDSFGKAEEEWHSRLEAVFEAIGDGINVTDLEANFVDSNRAFLSLFGIDSKEQVVGKPSMELIAEKDRAAIQAHIMAVLEGGVPVTREYRLLKVTGQEFDGETTAALMHDRAGKPLGFVSVTRDITERKQTENALRESENLFRMISEQSLVGIVILQEGQIVYLNDKVVQINEYSREEILAWKEDEFAKSIHPDDLERIFKAENKQRTGGYGDAGIAQFQFRAITKTGKVKWIDQYSRSVDYKGKLASLNIMIDITDRKQAEEGKASLEKQLSQTQKMESLGTLAGGIAHDFNNILAAIIGYTELALIDAQDSSRLQSNLRQVLHGGKRARDLVKQILTFSRQREHVRKPMEITTIVEESMKFHRATLPSTIAIRENLQVASGLILAAPMQLEQVMMNLCTNASQAMQEKGGILEVSLTEVELNPDDMVFYQDLIPGVYFKLAISDTGQGMTKPVMNRIFDPFFTTKGPGEGSGMGLAMVHGIVKRHGGAINVSSEPGKGTVFHVLLPRLEAQVFPAPQPDGASIVSNGQGHILFVDDEYFLVAAGEQLLKQLGNEVVARTSSLEALEAFRANPHKFDLVITDMTMPNMTGVDLSRKLLGIRPEIPIILCTGFSEAITPEEAQVIGIREILMKPILADELSKAIARALAPEERE